MRFRLFLLGLLATILVSACDYWPEHLEPLADSIGQEVSGEVTAWRVGGNVVVINVAGSPLYREDRAALEAAATNIAARAIDFVANPLESVSVTFHEGEVSEEAEKFREFIFLVNDNQPVLQPLLGDNATGPLTSGEIHALFVRLDEPLGEQREECVLREIEDRARAAGDPEALDPTAIEFLPVERWRELDRFGRRLILAQAISTKAFFVCGESGRRISE